jgi:hypothetical protein
MRKKGEEDVTDLLADADDGVGVAGSEVADGEVHPPHHAHLHQPDEMVQHGSSSSSSSCPSSFLMLLLTRSRSSPRRLVCNL